MAAIAGAAGDIRWAGTTTNTTPFLSLFSSYEVSRMMNKWQVAQPG